MDVPTDILEDLKCTQCNLYLSRGPIYLQHDGAAACGRCFSPKRPATRNKQYETVAKLLQFPCKNKDLGCQETVRYVDEEQEVVHEAVCEYRQYVCPVLGSARCDWLGTRSQILQHCQTQHPDRVLSNPCSLAHDISTSSLHNFVIKAFQVLFLLHTKVCVTSGKIYHSVRLLDASDKAKDFIYKLHIKRSEEEVIKKGDVAPQGCLALQEPTAVALDTNSLLSVLGGWNGATFTVTLEQRGRGHDPDTVQGQMPETLTVQGHEPVTVQGQRGQEPVTVQSQRQESCTPDKRVCANQGCTHQDIPDKCYKHERFFCLQGTVCCICRAGVPRGMLSAHYSSVHMLQNTWRITRTLQWRKCLVASPVGPAMCLYWLNYSRLDLQVSIPVVSERLREFRCMVRVTHPNTRLTRVYTPNITYSDTCDWRIIINRQNLSSWSSVYEISINILPHNTSFLTI